MACLLEFSEDARKAKHQGVVVLSIEVDANGNVRNIRVQRVWAWMRKRWTLYRAGAFVRDYSTASRSQPKPWWKWIFNYS